MRRNRRLGMPRRAPTPPERTAAAGGRTFARADAEDARRRDRVQRAAARRSRSTSSTTAARSATSGCGRRSLLSPALTAAGLAGVRSERAAKTWLPARLGAVLRSTASSAWSRTSAASHASPAASTSRCYNIVMGPPLLAPGSLALVGGIGHRRGGRSGASADARRATSARRATCRTPRPTRAAARPTSCRASATAITPQMHGRYPDYNVLDEADHWDEVDPQGRARPRRADVPPIRFFTATRGARRCGPSATS